MKHNKFLFLLILFLPAFVIAQVTIKGTVVDETNYPIPGASVSVKGTDRGKITNFDGEFKFVFKKTPKTLVVSFLGYATQEIIITNQKTVVVALVSKNNNLDEVVIIGYGSVNKKDLTGSLTTVKPKEDAVAQSQGVEDLLKGRAAGVLITGGTEPNSPSSIKIRGLNSLTSNTEPLYVIDGIIVNSATEDTIDPLSGGNSSLSKQGGITGVNPRDIASIQVLKDASATAIYGSRGANGVIIITTKKGKSGEVKYNFTTTSKMGIITNNIKVLNTEQYVEYQNEVRANQGFDPVYYVYPDKSFAVFETDEQYMIDNSATITRLKGVDWSDDTYVPSATQTYRVTASGGSDKHKFYIAGGYLKNEGITPRTFAKKTDFVANLNNRLTSKLKLQTKIGATYIENSASKGTDNLGSTKNNLVRQVISGAPVLGFVDNNFADDFNEALDGPRAWIKDYDDLAEEYRILGSMKLDYKFNKMFTYRLAFGGDYRFKERKIWYGNALFRGVQKNGEAGASTLERFRYNVDNTLMFNKKFDRNNRINGTIGATFDRSEIKNIANQASGFDDHSLRADGLQFVLDNPDSGFASVVQDEIRIEGRESIVSFLGRINYTLKNKYLFTATYRADGSSKFSKGNRWGHFPAFAFAWKAHKEKFLKKSNTISNAKFRLGWGLTGNQAIPNYQTFTLYSDNGTPYPDANGNPVTTFVPINLANPDITWETTSQYNTGLDLGFLKDKITTTVDVYYKNTQDLLLKRTIPASNGFTTIFANNGDLINKGVEFSLSADVIDNDKFNWNVFGNISFNKSKIDKLPQAPSQYGTETYSAFFGQNISGGNYFKTPANIFIEGEEPGLFFGFETNGIIATQDQLDNAPTINGIAPQLGDVLFVDHFGNDNDITDADKTIIGNPNPDFNYGFGSSVSYNGISLSFFFNGVQGNDIANGNLLQEAYADAASTNIRAEAYTNAWRVDNPNGTSPRVGYDLADNTGFTDRLIEDGSFLRLSNITLGYEIPVDKIKFIDNAYFSLSGQNLWLVTDYSGLDPEVNSFSYDPTRVGIDWNSFPNQKTYSMSLNITF